MPDSRSPLQDLCAQFGAPRHPTDGRKALLFEGVPGEGQALSSRARKADYKIDENGCWIWQKDKDRKGYGKISRRAAGTQWAHIAYWIAANGPRPTGRHIVIDHLCRVPSCVNPKHLEAVEQATNIHRGRSAKLNMEVARKVRARVIAGQSSAQIQADLGVSIQNVWWIAEDRAWREDPTAPRQPVWPKRDCLHCGEPVPSSRGRRAKYCSQAHAEAFNNEKRRAA